MIALAALMLRFVHVLVFALVASLGIASGAHALSAQPALRAFSSFGESASGDATCNAAEGVGKLGLSVRPAHRSIPFNRFRYYDPEAGQYTSQDPIGLLAGLRLQSYVPDPLTWSDPLGLELQGVNFAGTDALYPTTGDQKNIVQVPMQGTRRRDFTQANREAGLKKTPQGYTWQDRCAPGGVPAQGLRVPVRETFWRAVRHPEGSSHVAEPGLAREQRTQEDQGMPRMRLAHGEQSLYQDGPKAY